MSTEKSTKPLERLSPEEKEELNLKLLREEIKATKSGILQRRKKKVSTDSESAPDKKTA